MALTGRVLAGLAFLATTGCVEPSAAPRTKAASRPAPVVSPAASASSAPAPAAPDPFIEQVRSEARAIIAPLIELKAKAAGFVIRDGDRSATLTLGPRTAEPERPFNEATQFEIGSISKVLAGLLLADSVVRGELGLTDPANRWLPADLWPRGHASRPITLQDFASQAVSFSLMPKNWSERAPGVGYTREMFAEYLATFTHSFPPGEGYGYSNVSTALLAAALEQRTGKPYRTLLRERIFEPLGMTASGYADVPLETDDVLEGYELDGGLVPPRVDASPLGPCCIVRTTLDDVDRFIAAASGAPSLLEHAFELLAEPRRRIDEAGQRWTTLGWVAHPRQGMLWKNGRVRGTVSALVVFPGQRRGLFLIANREDVDIDAITQELVTHLLRPQPRIGAERHASFVVSGPSPAMVAGSATFGNTLRLEGWEAPKHVRAGETAHIRLFFRVLAQPDRDWEFFIHADSVPAKRAKRIGVDHFPGAGNDSTVFWRPGELVVDELDLVLPADYAAPDLDVWLGFYASDHRMPVTASDLEARNDRVKGPRISIEIGQSRSK